MARFRVMAIDEPGVGVIAELSAEIHGDLAGIDGCFKVGDCQITVVMAEDNDELDHDAAVIEAFIPYPPETFDADPEVLQGPATRMQEIVERYVLAFTLRTGRNTTLTWMGGAHIGTEAVATGQQGMFVSKRQHVPSG